MQTPAVTAICSEKSWLCMEAPDPQDMHMQSPSQQMEASCIRLSKWVTGMLSCCVP